MATAALWSVRNLGSPPGNSMQKTTPLSSFGKCRETMRGVTFLGERKLALAEFPDPVPGPGEVVIAIKASGMCGSDLKFYRAAGGDLAGARQGVGADHRRPRAVRRGGRA